MEIKNTDQIMRADIMLARIQDKNELKSAGQIYVGTDLQPDVVDASAGEDGKVAKPAVKNIQAAIRENAVIQKGLRLGNNENATYSNTVELGIGAKAEANGACQIGEGTNSERNSLQFGNKVVVHGTNEIFGDAVNAKEISSYGNMMFFDVSGNEISNKEFAFYVKDKDVLLEKSSEIMLPAHSSGIVVNTQESSNSSKVLNIMYMTEDNHVGYLREYYGKWFKCCDQLFKHTINLQSPVDNDDGAIVISYFTIFNYSNVEINTVEKLKKYINDGGAENVQYPTSGCLYMNNAIYNIVGVYLNNLEEAVFKYFYDESGKLTTNSYKTKKFTISDTILSVS